MFQAAGKVRPFWNNFVSQFDELGPQEIARRWEQARRLIHENGVTYNVYGDPKGMNRPWDLDAVPLMISASEWGTLQAALIQRTVLINEILNDLYGEQKLMRNGLLPPSLVFGHPGFLRACHDLRVPNRCYLNLSSVDIARGPDGRWLAIADRTQSPAGAGYVLENRIVLSRVFPDVFKHCQIHRLALFFRKMRETLASLAPHNRDNPRIVLLTPGPFNETYFEHAYLARYLNYTLVEGGDLTVRDACLYLKTLGGLHRVDVVLRRLDDDFCDPLELRADSALGVPGLVQALRMGNVALANPLGTGVAETPALNAFLPALCKHLLGEDLKLPSVTTYWCGDPASLEHAIANLPKMVIKPTFPMRGHDPVFCAKLSEEQRAEMIGRIRKKPHQFVAQEQIALSSVPSLEDGRLQPRQAVLRTYLVSNDKSFSVMPGGLTQIPNTVDTLVFSLQRGGGSKDTWIQADGPVSTFSLLRPAGQHIEISRGGSDLPSRVADNLFWLGRYVERSECMVRLLRAIVIRLTEKSASAEVRELPQLIEAFRHQRRISIGKSNGSGPESVQTDELKQVLDESFSIGGLHGTLASLQVVARAVRDRISNDTWRVIMSLEPNLVWPKPLEGEQLHEELARLNFMLTALASFGGLASESMTRGQVWRFMDMGRRLERAANLASLMHSTLIRAGTEEVSLLEAVLEIADSSMTYRRRYLASLQMAPLLDLLLVDESNPRSMAFQLSALSGHVENLPRDNSQPFMTQQQRVVFGCIAALRLLDIDSVCEINEGGSRESLAYLLERIRHDLSALSDLITRDYLSHAQASRQLASFRGEAL